MRLFVVTFLLLVFALSVIAQEERTADQYSMAEKIEAGKPYHGEHAEMMEPFTVVGNLHSVGAKNIGIYLITTDQGHILIDTGVNEMHEGILNNIRQLGFVTDDIKILLSTHAHFDHVQGHEAMRLATDAEVMAVGLDAEALRLGKDISPLGFEGWKPVGEVTTLRHGDTVALGKVVVTAHQIPGHTQGCTVWTLPVSEDNTVFDVAIFGCRGPNSIVKVQDNPDFPDLIEQSRLGFQRLKEVKADIYVSNHPESTNERFGAAMQAGERPHPLLEQTPWRELVADLEASFEERLR